MAKLPHKTDGGFGSRARVGVIVLATDQTLENEFRSLPLPGIAIHHARIANDLHVSRSSLKAMKQKLPDAASLLPTEFEFDSIGYGCTSAATLIGDEAVAAAIQSVHPGVPVTNPVNAAAEAFKSLRAKRIGVLTPYSEAVTLPVIKRLEEGGLTVATFGSFLVEDDLAVGRITADSVMAGVHKLSDEAPCDAYFVSCTSIRLFAFVDRLEDEIGVPVVSSNLALAWHLMRLAGINDQFAGFGSLLARA